MISAFLKAKHGQLVRRWISGAFIILHSCCLTKPAKHPNIIWDKHQAVSFIIISISPEIVPRVAAFPSHTVCFLIMNPEHNFAENFGEIFCVIYSVITVLLEGRVPVTLVRQRLSVGGPPPRSFPPLIPQ